MKTTGTVKSIDGKYAQVSVIRTSACDGCHSKDFCLSCSKKEMTVSVLNDIGAVPGDTVELYSPTGRVLGYAALVFVLPIVIAILGYIGAYYTLGEGSAAIGAVVAFLITFAVIGVVFNTSTAKKKARMHISKIIK
ncbi:MAG: SoxR reducing system RseC family protein [Clostridia bacterium]|nr:SoxR reducing system RseC family protein [Clostridia bacterium]